MTPETLAIVLSEPACRRVFAAVVLGAATSAEILGTPGLGLGAPEAAPAIGRLVRDGLLVSAGPGRLAVHQDHLFEAAGIAERQQDEQAAAEQPDPLLRGYVRHGVVVHLPEYGVARRDVLAHVARTTFTYGEDYDERTTTDLLRPWCETGAVDAVSLRRFLVDEDFLEREAGHYRLHRPESFDQP